MLVAQASHSRQASRVLLYRAHQLMQETVGNIDSCSLLMLVWFTKCTQSGACTTAVVILLNTLAHALRRLEGIGLVLMSKSYTLVFQLV